MRTPLLPAAAAFAAGIVLGRSFLYFPATTVTVVLLSLAAGLAAQKRGALKGADIGLAAVCGLAGAALLLHSVLQLPAGHYLRQDPAPWGAHTVSGRIVSPLDRDPGRTAFILAVTDIDGRPASGRMRATVREELQAAGYGDLVQAAGTVRQPQGSRNPGGFDYAEHLARQEVYASLSVNRPDSFDVLEGGGGTFRALQDWRERIRGHLRAATSGPASAILQAMVLGEEGDLTDEVRDRFMAAGVTHILSISGSHLGLVALVCFAVVRRLLFALPEPHLQRLTLRIDVRKLAAAAALPPVVFYAMLAGGQVATLRSLIMIIAAGAAVLSDRESPVLNSLAAAALVILVPSPQTLFDLSFQLSFLSVLAITFTVQVWNASVPAADGTLSKIGRHTGLLVAVSLAASIATGPLVAASFRQASLAGLFANLIVIPFAGLVIVPAGLASSIASLVLGELPVPGLLQSAASVFDRTVALFAGLPFAEFHPPAPGPVALAALAVLTVTAALIVRARVLAVRAPLEGLRRAPRAAYAGAAAAAAVLMAAVLFAAFPLRTPRVTFLDVGQGDCALIELPGGRTALIDAGGVPGGRFDVGRRIVAPYLRDRAIRRLDLAILSHPHPDHAGGFPAVVREFRPRELWMSGYDRDLPGGAELMRTAEDAGVPARAVKAGARASLDGAELEVLHPPADLRTMPGYAAENDRSLVVRLSAAGRTALFTGDAGGRTITSLLRAGADLASDVIKVPHHGSRSSAAEALAAASRPSLAVISVGAGNPYRHPAPDVLEAYHAAGARILRTDHDGAVLVTLGKDGADAVAWADLLLRRAVAAEAGSWTATERKNWTRLFRRMLL